MFLKGDSVHANASLKLGAREIFCAVRQQPSLDEKARVLDDLCKGDEPLRLQVEHLLAAAVSLSPLDRMGAMLSPTELNVDSDSSRLPVVDIENHPMIGPYKLLEQIGEGGMGIVYMAQQQTPIRRTVALKIIKPGMGSREVVTRFEVERQALAMMNHPHIAKVLDAGATESGNPYFVMELVKGIPITKFCDVHRLDLRKRLDLFLKVCGAVQHAHQKGIIHRDLKPSNILVELENVTAVPKVIDFGVAKATEQSLTERTFHTGFSQMIGTPLYMSPEQAQLNSLDVDTRSDIYSLGVLLYELLTGNTPFDRDALKQAGIDEMRRIIREVEPPRPSHRISTLAVALQSTVSEQRNIDPRKLCSTMRGELDWIVMKALEKDRTRRYESASAFTADVQRFLDGDAVLARPPSRAYRMTKFIGRYRVLLSTAALIAIVLTGGLVTTAWQAFRARRAEQVSRLAEQNANQQLVRALQAEKDADLQAARAKQAAEAAELDAAIAKAVNEFITNDLLAQADPNKEPNREISLRMVVDRAAIAVADRFPNQPLVEVAIRQTLGETFFSLGLALKAEEQYSRALAICLDHLGGEHPMTLTIKHNLARTFSLQGRAKEGQRLHEEVLTMRRTKLGEEHPETLESRGSLLWNLRSTGEKEIEGKARELWEIQQRILGAEHSSTLRTMDLLATLIFDSKRFSEAEELFRKLAEIGERLLGAEHPKTLLYLSHLEAAIANQGRLMEAEELNLRILETQQKVLGDEHPQTIGSRQSAVVFMSRQGRHVEAEYVLRELFEIQQRLFGNEKLDTIQTGANLVIGLNKSAKLLDSKDKFAEAESLSRDLFEISSRVLGDEHELSMIFLMEQARAIFKQNRYGEAANLFRHHMQLCQHVFGQEHSETTRSITNLAVVGWQLATAPDPSRCDPAKAVEICRETIQLRPENAGCRENLGVALNRNSQWQESVENLEKARLMIDEFDRTNLMFLAISYWQLGEQNMAYKRYAEGAAWIEANKNDTRQRFRAEAEDLMGISELERNELIARYYGQVDPNEAKALLARGLWNQSQNKHEAAIDDLTAAIKLDPNSTNFVLWRARGVSHSRLGQLQEALTDLCMANKLKPSASEPLRERGLVYQKLGKLDLALADFSKNVELKPSPVSERQNYFHRAGIYRDLKEFDMALKDCETAIAIDPDNDTSVFRRSTAFALRGDILAEDLQQYQAAVDEYSRAIDLDPENATYSEKRARALEKTGDTQPASSHPTATS